MRPTGRFALQYDDDKLGHAFNVNIVVMARLHSVAEDKSFIIITKRNFIR